MLTLPWWLYLACGGAAVLYASVGLGGGTAYLAFLALTDATPDQLRVTVLVMNVVVATLSFKSFTQAGHLRVELIPPFLSTSIVAAFLGALLPLPKRPFEVTLGVTLLLVGTYMLLWREGRIRARGLSPQAAWRIGPIVGVFAGGLAGIASIGGGVFLAPILVLAGWATSKQAAPVAACFVLVNSLSGLLAHLARRNWPEPWLWPLLVVVVAGGVIGARLGSRRFSDLMIKRLFGAIVVIIALRLLWRG